MIDPSISFELSQSLILSGMFISIVTIPALATGLIISFIQAATQINEQTLTFIPRLFICFFMLFLFGPWMLQRLIDFSIRLFQDTWLSLG